MTVDCSVTSVVQVGGSSLNSVRGVDFGILGILGRNLGIRSHRRRMRFDGPDVELFPFRHAQPKIEVTGKKALAATSPA